MKEIAPHIYASTAYPGVNVGLIAMPNGSIAVDVPTLPQHAQAWRQQILETTGAPILYVVLTDSHPDRLLSAEILSGSGEAPIVATQAAYDRASAYTDGFWRGVVEGWTRRYPEAAGELAGQRGALPEIMFTHDLTLRKGGEDVTITQVDGAAPGSAWIYLSEQDVLFAGDTVTVDDVPFLGATPDSKAWMNTLSVLRRSRYAQTVIVPGRGPICDQSATRQISDYIALARRKVRSLYTGSQGRADTALLMDEMLSLFPVSEAEQEWAQRSIKAGLEQLYEELSKDHDG
jgi:glyoxylase-like metal-dependent hydrolase (beta-lactamase superfamily II)